MNKHIALQNMTELYIITETLNLNQFEVRSSQKYCIFGKKSQVSQKDKMMIHIKYKTLFQRLNQQALSTNTI